MMQLPMGILSAGRSEAAAIAKPEAVEDRNYTDIITDALVDAAANPISDAYVGALETAAGQLSRAFASATLSGAGRLIFTPWVMAQIGRALVESGEAVWYRRALGLVRAESYSILPSGRYEFQGRTRPPDRVFHVRWNLEPETGRGLGPLGLARTLRSMLQRLEKSLGNEANASVGYLLPVPEDPDSPRMQKVKAQLASLEGRIAMAETIAGGWGQSGPAPREDFKLARLGPNIPDSSVRLFVAAREAVLSACGFPVSLAQEADGTAQREAWRRYLHGSVAPLGRLVATEAARIGLPITIDFDALFASDISGRARAFQSLVGGGMDLAQAAAISGLLSEEA